MKKPLIGDGLSVDRHSVCPTDHFPSFTVYFLSGRQTSADTIELFFERKGRKEKKDKTVKIGRQEIWGAIRTTSPPVIPCELVVELSTAAFEIYGTLIVRGSHVSFVFDLANLENFGDKTLLSFSSIGRLPLNFLCLHSK